MKKIVLFLMLTTFGVANATEVNSKAIQQATAEFAKALNYTVTVKGMKVKGNNVKEMLLDYAKKQELEIEDLRMNNNDVQMSDETTFGSTSMKEAFGVVGGMIDELREEAEANETTINLNEMLSHLSKGKKLFQQSGVEFGYNGFGESGCGMIYTTILVIDKAKKIIYEIASGVDYSC